MPIVHCIIMRSLAVHDLVGFFMDFSGFRFSSNRHNRQKELIDLGQFLDDSGRLLHDMVDPVQFDL